MIADGNQPKPTYTAKGWQVIVVDYDSDSQLQFHMAGVDLVISMISGPAQLALIDAACNANVRRFAPAEFSGSLRYRPVIDPLDHGKSETLLRLQQYVSYGMSYTVLSCGLLYEHFGPGGLAASNIGHASGLNGEGDLLMNVRGWRAQIPVAASGQPATVCMTSAQDVGRLVVAALEMPEWPSELRMCGDRMNTHQVVTVAEAMLSECSSKPVSNLDN